MFSVPAFLPRHVLSALLALGVLLPGTAFAVSASPDPLEIRQPDGSTQQLYLRGDESRHWHTDARGFPVIQGPAGKAWFLGRLEAGRLVATPHLLGSIDPPDAGLARPSLRELRKDAEEIRALAPVETAHPTASPSGTMRTIWLRDQPRRGRLTPWDSTALNSPVVSIS